MKYKMKMVKLADIDASDRYREDLGNIDELVESIKEKGIIQPICVDTNLRLLAGGRRHHAAGIAGLLDIPVLIRESSGEIDAREIELMENIHRKEMTWQEQAKLTARIHALYKEKDEDWSVRATGRLLEQSPMSISRALRLAAGMEVLPEIEDCGSADEAGKVIKKAEENAIVAELAKRQQNLVLESQGPIANSKMSVKDRGIANSLKVANEDYRIGDVFAGLKGLRTDGHIDFIECDPPYGVELDILTQRGGQTIVNKRDASYQEVKEEDYETFISNLASELYRVGAKDCWMVFWFAFKWMGTVRSALLDAGWSIDEVPALWCKGSGRTPRPDILLARAYEPFFIARKGQPTIIKQGRMNTWLRSQDEKKYHPAQRPLGLMKEILGTFLDERQHTVLVPFLGSGTTLRACYDMGHRGFGWDKDGQYKNHFMLAVEEDTKKLLAKE